MPRASSAPCMKRARAASRSPASSRHSPSSTNSAARRCGSDAHPRPARARHLAASSKASTRRARCAACSQCAAAASACSGPACSRWSATTACNERIDREPLLEHRRGPKVQLRSTRRIDATEDDVTHEVVTEPEVRSVIDSSHEARRRPPLSRPSVASATPIRRSERRSRPRTGSPRSLPPAGSPPRVPRAVPVDARSLRRRPRARPPGATSTRPDCAMSWPNSQTNSGLPALRSMTVPVAPAETWSPAADRNSSDAASSDRRGTASVTPTRASSATCSRASSSGRYVPTSRQPASRTADATAHRTRIDAASAHWRSSSTTTSGPLDASPRTTAEIASDCAKHAAGEAAGDSASNWLSISSVPASWRRICTHGHNGGAPSPCHAVAHAAATPPLAAEGNDLLGQPGLADPRLAGQQERRAPRCVQVGQASRRHRQLRLTPQQRADTVQRTRSHHASTVGPADAARLRAPARAAGGSPALWRLTRLSPRRRSAAIP